MAKPPKITAAERRPQHAVVPPAAGNQEKETYTTTKREDGFFWKHSVFKYVDGRRTGIETAAVYIELNRGVEFKPRAFCASFKGTGWNPGDLDANELIDVLEARAADRSTHTCRWKDRRRPDVQKHLEERVESLEQTNQEWEALFKAAVGQHPELAALRGTLQEVDA